MSEVNVERLTGKLATYLSSLAEANEVGQKAFNQARSKAVKILPQFLRSVAEKVEDTTQQSPDLALRKLREIARSANDGLDLERGVCTQLSSLISDGIVEGIEPSLRAWSTEFMDDSEYKSHRLEARIRADQIKMEQTGKDVRITVIPSDAENAKNIYHHLLLLGESQFKELGVTAQLPISERGKAPVEGSLLEEMSHSLREQPMPQDTPERRATLQKREEYYAQLEADQRGPFEIILPNATIAELDNALTKHQSRRTGVAPAKENS